MINGGVGAINMPNLEATSLMITQIGGNNFTPLIGSILLFLLLYFIGVKVTKFLFSVVALLR